MNEERMVTMWHECSKCGKPCETRKEWFWDESTGATRLVKIETVSYCCDAPVVVASSRGASSHSPKEVK